MDLKNKKEIKILIIDDSSDDAFLIERQLKKDNIHARCLRVDSPGKLIEAIENENWDVALCDIKMPLLEPQLVMEIMAGSQPPEIPIILMSGVVDLSSLPGFIRGGVRDFLPKDHLHRLSTMINREFFYIEAIRSQIIQHQMFNEAQKLEAIGTLAGGVAHDFNNILTALFGLQFRLKKQYSDLPDLCKEVGRMDELCDRASNLVRQLLGFARKGIVPVEKLELNKFIDNNLDFFRMSVPENIELQWQSKKHLHIMSDPTLLQQMLINLINNARDAVVDENSPSISISIGTCTKANSKFLQLNETEVEDWVCLSITNNGQPIPEEVRAHIFEPFFTTKEQGKGTGLGLAMVYGSMKNMGGFIEVISEKPADPTDPCTRFHLYFPAISSSKASISLTDLPNMEVNNQSAQSHCILVADDEDMVLDVLEGILDIGGYQSETCVDGRLALQAFERDPERYSAVILDVVMPHMSGPEAAKAIRAQSDIPIMLISGYDIDRSLDIVKNISGLSIVTKPFTPDKLLANISEMLNAHEDS